MGQQYNSRAFKNTRAEQPSESLHNIILPGSALAVGIIGFIVWLGQQQSAGVKDATAIAELAIVCIIIKFLIIGAMVLHRGKQSGGGFSGVGPAMLKVAALILFLDVGYLWMRVVLLKNGSISPDGQGPIEVYLVEFVVLAVIGFVTPRFVFQMEDTEAITMGGVVFAVNIISNLVLVVMIITILHWMHPTGIASVLPPAPTPGPLTGAQTKPKLTGVAITDDAGVVAYLRRGTPFVIDARDWLRRGHMTKGANGTPTEKLIDQLYLSHALAVDIDEFGGPSAHGGLHFGSGRIFVQLPALPADRDSCIQAATDYRQTMGLPPESPAGPGFQRFLVIDL